jgi:hypothetical protein
MNINDIMGLPPEQIAKLKLLLQVFQQNDVDMRPRRKDRVYLPNMAVDTATDRKLKFAALTTQTFRNAGYLDAVAHQNIFTAKKWEARGFRIKAGERAVKVKGLVMFHVSQVEPIALVSKAEVRQVTDEMVAAYLARKAKAAAEMKAAQDAITAKMDADAKAAYGTGYEYVGA